MDYELSMILPDGAINDPLYLTAWILDNDLYISYPPAGGAVSRATAERADGSHPTYEKLL